MVRNILGMSFDGHLFVFFRLNKREKLSRPRGQEQNREEGEMAQIKLGGGRNRGGGGKVGRKEKKKS